MKNLWSKEDIANFNNSEVFSELEARVIETIKRADILSNKIAVDADSIRQTTQAVKELGTELSKIKDINFSDDLIEDSEEENEEKDASNSILNELYCMAKEAIDAGDYKLAYRIERTIDEIVEPEVKCQ